MAELGDMYTCDVRAVKTLLFNGDIDKEDSCEVLVDVKEIESNGYECYDITFTILGNRQYNPIRMFEDDEGVIVAKNGMTKSMVEYLLMDDEELLKGIGMTTLESYRGEIMRALMRLWD